MRKLIRNRIWNDWFNALVFDVFDVLGVVGVSLYGNLGANPRMRVEIDSEMPSLIPILNGADAGAPL